MTRLGTLALVAALATGCGSTAIDSARRGVLLSADALAITDDHAAVAYTAAADSAMAESATLADFRRLMQPYDALESALRVARAAILAAEAAIDTWEATGKPDPWIRAAACALGALKHVLAVLEQVGVEPPRALRDAIGAVASFSGGFCRGD